MVLDQLTAPGCRLPLALSLLVQPSTNQHLDQQPVQSLQHHPYIAWISLQSQTPRDQSPGPIPESPPAAMRCATIPILAQLQRVRHQLLRRETKAATSDDCYGGVPLGSADASAPDGSPPGAAVKHGRAASPQAHHGFSLSGAVLFESVRASPAPSPQRWTCHRRSPVRRTTWPAEFSFAR